MPAELSPNDLAVITKWSGPVADEESEALQARIDLLGDVRFVALERMDQKISAAAFGEPAKQSADGHMAWDSSNNLKLMESLRKGLADSLGTVEATTQAGREFLEEALGAAPVQYELRAPR